MTSSQKPDVSVIAVAYNQADVLIQQLHALLAQDYKGKIELIVCDDGSDIKSLAALFRAYMFSSIDVRWIWQPDLGIRTSRARNNGLREAKGEIVVFLDGDMIPETDFVSRHVDIHQKHPYERLLVAGNRLWADESQLEIRGMPFPEVLAGLRREARHDEKVLSLQRSFYAGVNPWRACFTCNLSVPRSSLVFFDETFDGAWGLEDSEMACRLTERHGHRPYFDEKIIAYHYQLRGAEFNVYRRGRHDEIVIFMRNICYFIDKYPDLDLSDQYHGLEKFVLDPDTNKWFVKRTKVGQVDMLQVVSRIRAWLKENSIYPLPGGVYK